MEYTVEKGIQCIKKILDIRKTTKENPFHLATTVHKDITDRVERIDPELAKSVRQVLEVNKAERHIRGGLATREKYLHHKNK